MPSVVTANNLRSGAVVYLGSEGRWVDDLASAVTADSDAERAHLESIAQRSVAANLVVGPYLMDVALIDGIPAPVCVRETIRAQRGPSVMSSNIEPAGVAPYQNS